MKTLLSPSSRRVSLLLFLAWGALALGSLVFVLPAAAADDELDRRERQELLEALPTKYRQWLDGVSYIISEPERDLFLQLEKDYQRDAFIEKFWEVRDPYPRTPRNELRENYESRLSEAQRLFEGENDERTRVLLTNGFPLQRVEVRCKPYLVPAEVWYYDGSEAVSFEFLLLFYKKWGAGKFRIWEPFDGLDALSLEGDSISGQRIIDRCGQRGEAVIAAIRWLETQGGRLGATALLDRIVRAPEAPQREWVATFATYTTELPEDAATFDASVEISFPGRNQSRTIVQGGVLVPKANVAPVEVGDGLSQTYNLLLTGEILREDALFDSFRYRFDIPAADAGEDLPLVFQRYLRPGEYTLMVRVEDLGSGAYHRSEQVLEVPKVDEAPPPPMNARTAALVEEANRALRTGEVTVQIPPFLGTWQTGMVRIDAVTTGDGIDRASFFLDDQPILTKRRPPWNVELDLGDVPRSRVLRVELYDAAGKVLASDERMLNAGDHRFAVRLEEPRPGRRYSKSLRAEANIVVPKGEAVERVEFYLDEKKISTLYQPPWIQPIVLPPGAPVAYVRAAAFTPDGAMAEDLVFVNAPENLEEIDVEFVELYTLVLDRSNRPVQDLQESDFTVLEDDVRQELVRFEKVENLPIHASILLDISASMEGRLDPAREAAVHFFEQAITPKDRATAITFNDHPNLAVDFTNDVSRLASGLAGLKPERGTALYDALIFTLYYFNGVNGQRAILLLSDGKDESSKYTFDDVLEYARRSGVSIYSIGLDLPGTDFDSRRKLSKLAEETGGRSFFLDEVTELEGVYDTIQRELRSRYLLAYQSSNTSGSEGFRTIEVEVDRSGVEAKTLRGYYP